MKIFFYASVAVPMLFYPSIRDSKQVFFHIPDSISNSVVDPKLFFSGSGSYLDLNFGSGFESGSGLLMKNTLEVQMI
jgi:hypothetical protein